MYKKIVTNFHKWRNVLIMLYKLVKYKHGVYCTPRWWLRLVATHCVVKNFFLYAIELTCRSYQIAGLTFEPSIKLNVGRIEMNKILG